MSTAESPPDAIAAPPAAAAKNPGLVTLDELIGDTSSLSVEKGSLEVRGLNVVYWRYTSAACTSPPVVALHGGPAMPHNYILPLKLLALRGIPVIFFDQAGCGESDMKAAADPAKDTPWLLTVDYYVEELRALVAHLQLDEYYLYGSSWGTILAQEYAVALAKEDSAPAGRLLGMVLDGALCDAKFYIKSQWRQRLATLPAFTQRLLRKLEDEKAYEDPRYTAITEGLTSHFTCRMLPKPDFWFDTFGGCNGQIYAAMQGVSEFTTGGVLENWTITDRLGAVSVPTLVVRGEFDTMTEECHQLVVDSISTAQPLLCIPRAGHCKLIDEPQLCCDAVEKFVAGVEASRTA